MKYVIILLFITQAQSVNSSIISNAKMANALKSFNAIYTGNLINGFKYELTTTQKSVLTDLAQQCPYEFGPAVFQARTYLKACGDSVEYSNPCENLVSVSGARIIAPDGKVIKGIEINVFPNPAESAITLNSSLPTGVSGEIVFFDGIGNKLFSVKLTEGDNAMDVDISKYAAGLYYYKAFANGQVVSTNKLMIIK